MHIIHRNSEVIEFSSSRNINLDSGTTLELVSWFHFLSLHCGVFSYQHALYHVNNLIFLQLFFAAFIMRISHNPDFDEHSRCCKRSREKPFLFWRRRIIRHIHLEIASLFIHFTPALVHLISDITAPICAEQSERKPLLWLSFSSGLQSQWHNVVHGPLQDTSCYLSLWIHTQVASLFLICKIPNPIISLAK